MRRLLALFILAASWLAASDVADLHPPSDALLVTSFNTGSALDRSWGQRTPTTGAGVTFPAGYRTADFGGASNAVVSYPDNAEMETPPLTVACWIRIDSYTGIRGIIHKIPQATSYNGWVFYYSPGFGSRGLGFGQVESADLTPDADKALQTYTATGTLSAGTWYHVAATLSAIGSTPILYINGVATSTTSLGNASGLTTFANSEPVRIGGKAGPESGFYSFHDGGIDDVRIYSAVKTANEIGAIYAEGIGESRP